MPGLGITLLRRSDCAPKLDLVVKVPSVPFTGGSVPVTGPLVPLTGGSVPLTGLF